MIELSWTIPFRETIENKNCIKTYRVQNGNPVLHGDALEDGEHGEPDVVKAGEPVVGAGPLLQANRGVGVAHVGAPRRVLRSQGWLQFEQAPFKND